MTERNLTARCATAVLAGATILLLSACGPEAAQRDEASGEVTAASDADVFSVQVGDCLDMATIASAAEVETVPTVPCADPHDGEVYAETSLEGDEVPADLAELADTFCYDAFEPFIGMAYEESSVDFSYFAPTEGSWGQGDRAVQCIAVVAEPTTGTLEGAAV